MAILKGINGGSFSGSVGKVTFRKGLKGKIIASQKAESVSNPRTHAQQEQRMYMKTAVTAYSAMKEICNHSFEGVPYGQKSMAKFIELNVKQIQNFYDSHLSGFTFCKNGNVAPHRYIVAKGSLTSIDVKYEEGKLLLKRGELESIREDLREWQHLSNYYDLKPGDQLELIGFIQDRETLETWDEIDMQANLRFMYSKYVFKKDLQPTTPVINNYATNWETERAFTERVDNEFLQIVPDSKKYLQITSNSHIWCAAVIVSRKRGNKWLRSYAEMAINGKAVPPAYKYDNVIKTYNATSAKYLNNATD